MACLWWTMNLHEMYCSEIEWEVRGMCLCAIVLVCTYIMHIQGVFMFTFVLISLFRTRSSAATQSHYPNLQLHYSPAPPQGGHLNTPMLLISWWSYSVPVLYNSRRVHSSATPPPPPPVFPFFLSLNDVTKELALAPFQNNTWNVPAPLFIEDNSFDAKRDHSNQQTTVTNFAAQVKLLATILQHRLIV